MNINHKIHIKRQQNQGVVLLITLIMLVAMTLGGIALIRSVHTTTLIAGNLAFQQASTQSANIGSEQAIAWLTSKNSNGGLDTHSLANGYSASRRVPPAGTSWDSYWVNTLQPAGAVTVASDAAGNTAQYVIDRLCNSTGAAVGGIGCATSPIASTSNRNSHGAGTVTLSFNSAVFYRIITRVQGPRSTASFVETIVAM